MEYPIFIILGSPNLKNRGGVTQTSTVTGISLHGKGKEPGKKDRYYSMTTRKINVYLFVLSGYHLTAMCGTKLCQLSL